MKLVLLLFFVSSASFAFSQVDSTDQADDSFYNPSVQQLRREILALRQQTEEIQFHLNKSQREFKVGTILYAVGFGLVIVGSSSAANNGGGAGLVTAGSLLFLSGIVLHIDSHKHIGRAGISQRRSRQ